MEEMHVLFQLYLQSFNILAISDATTDANTVSTDNRVKFTFIVLAYHFALK